MGGGGRGVTSTRGFGTAPDFNAPVSEYKRGELCQEAALKANQLVERWVDSRAEILAANDSDYQESEMSSDNRSYETHRSNANDRSDPSTDSKDGDVPSD